MWLKLLICHDGGGIEKSLGITILGGICDKLSTPS
jgi:hypothetical protein